MVNKIKFHTIILHFFIVVAATGTSIIMILIGSSLLVSLKITKIYLLLSIRAIKIETINMFLFFTLKGKHFLPN